MSRCHAARGFNLLEVLIAMVIGLALIAAFIAILQRTSRDTTAIESLSRLQDSARHALRVLVADIEHAGFYGLSSAGRPRLVRGGATLADAESLVQPGATRAVNAVVGLPKGAHDCGVNFAVDVIRVVQGNDNGFALGRDARDCAPTASAGGAAAAADTLTVRHASRDTTAPRAGRLQVYSSARSLDPLLLFADGRAPGPRDDQHEVRDLDVRSYYIASSSVGRAGFPALRVKSLTESRGAAQFRDEELMPGVEDLQLELGVRSDESGSPVVRFVAPDAPGAESGRIVAVRLWLRVRADRTEAGFFDDRPLRYANVVFSTSAVEAAQRRMLVERTVALRNPAP
jgi:prepilin-type N-terminal cleavage/methylation domain-containing protein